MYRNSEPVRLPDFRQSVGTVQPVLDTRGLDLSPDLNNPREPLNDPLATIGSITVVRRDGNAITAADLTITPSWGGSPVIPPWLTMLALGPATPTGFFANWWQGVNFTIAASGPVDYQITLAGTTAAGREVAWDAYQLVVAASG
nr:hypothetical protein [uncultured Rhodopila sp.]